MNSFKIPFFFIITLLIISSFNQSEKKAESTSDDFVRLLLSKMSIEEKVGQMAQVTVDVFGKKGLPGTPFTLDQKKVNDAIVKYKIGSVLNTADAAAMPYKTWNDIIASLQEETQKTKLRIPLIYGFDAIHGATYVSTATLFPQQIGQAATWNLKMVHDAAAATAYESRAASVPWNFSPVLDLGVNPLWPRLWETFGEDPYLVTQMGLQVIDGYQNPIGSKQKVAACVKHFIGYSETKSGKDRTNAWIPENYLREYHFPAFKAAVKAGAMSVMVNSALINGVPVHANKYLLTDVLKKELGFKGVIVTDWQDIDNIATRDKIVATKKEALMLAINAGIDMAMIPYDYEKFCNDLIALVKENKVSMSRIDDAVTRILTMKKELDIFTTPVTFADAYPKAGSAEFENLAYEAAAESVVLLKNKNDILPIAENSKILVTGPNANSMRALNGGWSYSWQGDKAEAFTGNYHSIAQALSIKGGKENVSFVEGVAYKKKGKYFEDSVVNIDAVIAASSGVSYIVLCLGENSYTEKPGDLNDLFLSENQLALAEAVIKTGKKVILILNEGRPRIISKIEPDIPAILQSFLPGNFGGDALADIIYGKINPSGKLPITYPRYVNALTNYIHKPSDEQSNPQGAYDYSADYNPQYNFGFGLSYTSFHYSDLQLEKYELTPDEALKLTVKLKNTGERAGKEVVQLYISDLVATLSPDSKRLRAFQKIDLKPGEEKTVTFVVPVKEFAFVNAQNKMTLEKGEFRLEIHGLANKFMINKTTTW